MKTRFNSVIAMLGIVRHDLKKDFIFFFIPFFLVLLIGLIFCYAYGEGLTGIWRVLWKLIKQPQNTGEIPIHRSIGIALFFGGLSLMIISQATLWKNYSGFVVIKKTHKLITRGIYRYSRNPIYLGLFIACIGLSVYAASFFAFLIMLLLIPITLNRIKLEERLLGEEFKESYLRYKENTKKLIPFVY